MVTCRHVQNQQLTHCPRSPLEGRQAADKCCESATARAAPQPPGHRAARSACAPRLRLQTPHSHPGHQKEITGFLQKKLIFHLLIKYSRP